MTSSLIRRIENTRAADPTLESLQRAATSLLDHPVPMDVLSGRVVGHPLHPAIVQIPLGCWVGACAIDMLGGQPARPAARMLVGLGVVSSAPAVLSGLAEWVHTRDAERRVGAVHAAVNALGVVFFGASWWRRRAGDGSGRRSALAGMAVVGMGGWLGGHLAYNRGVGVNTAAFLPVLRTWTSVVSRAAVGPGSITGASANGVAIALAEHPPGDGIETGAVVAMESRCTHRGGPLHEGTLEGGCIRCPWHGSLFDLVTGEPRRGPASVGQLVYRTRVIDGQVEVMGDDPGGLRNAVI